MAIMWMMELHQLRYFCAVARAGSFTRAAEFEGVAQPSLSQAIHKLEAELGSPLFERLGRRVKLTPAGEALLPDAKAALGHLQSAKAAVQQLQEGVKGQLRVGVIPTILPYFLAPRLRRFADACPDVDLELTEETTERLIERLRAGDLDLALLALPVKQPELIVSELFRERLLLAVPPGHPAARAAEADLGALEQERFLLLREGHCLRDEVLTVCTRARAQFHSVFESDQMASLFPLVKSGFGISLVPEMAAGHAAGCKLVPLTRNAVRRVGYARLRHRRSTPARAAFTAWLREESKELKS